MEQKAYMEIETGIIYTVLPYTEQAVYINCSTNPYENNSSSIRNDYFDWLIKEREWIELKREDGLNEER